MTAPSATETHISTLFFTGDRVFKLLKPIATGFLDHRTIAARLHAAKREHELNRRVAPDVYLGLADVSEGGAVVDRMVVMRRLPADRSLSAIIGRGELTDSHIRSVARAVATFHSSLDPIPVANLPNTVDELRTNWESSFTELEPFVGDILDPQTNEQLQSLVTRYLDAHRSIFETREREGYVRDGHGDLLADDIFMLPDGPRILDCLAFDDRLRIADVLSDIAFLAMDMHRLAGPRAAADLIRYYCSFSGESHPGSLAHHYVSYRAHVRCKVACLRVAQGGPAFGSVARMYHRLALDQAERARTRLVLVGGGPGTGKTSISNRLGQLMSWATISSDTVRKDLAGVAHLDHAVARPDQGIYAPEHTAATYDEVLRQAALLLRAGESVVVDASWTAAEHRSRARSLGRELMADLVEIECVVEPAIARERVSRRLADQWNPSDATPEIVDHLRDKRDEWPEARRIDTARPVDDAVEEAIDVLLDRRAPAPGVPAGHAADFWGTYVAYGEVSRHEPFHTVVDLSGSM